MNSQHFQGKPIGNEQSQVCLLFDPKDGRVAHGHGITILEFAKPVEPAELEARARKHAKTLGKSVEGLKALHLPYAAIQPHTAFKVNAEGTGIVPLPVVPHHRNRS
jgi:hypothetical protein